MGLIAYIKSLFILQLLVGFVFVVSGLIINFIQLCTCVLWPIDRQLYRKINTRLSYSLWSQLVMLLEWWSGTECTIFTDQATASKVLAKYELLKVPLIGWTWYFLEIVFCKRKWEEDRDTVFKGLTQLKDYPEFMWFLLYCEGTRFTPKKHEISMEVAESKGLPKLKYHLLPRTKGFTTTLSCLKGTVSAVYDVTLNFRDKKVPTLLGIVSGKKYMADMNIKRYPVEEIPEDEKECATWLHELYQRKDALQEHYEKEGSFPGPTIKPPRRLWTLLNFLFWATLLLTPLLNFACGVFVSGSPLLIVGFLIFCIIASIAVRRLISVSEVNKTGSTYGKMEGKKEN
ncbi:unnamed protein product [Coregonus sp. 'balchen']|nr:unnamed protein product [Coregonus sp. 'balchen']